MRVEHSIESRPMASHARRWRQRQYDNPASETHKAAYKSKRQLEDAFKVAIAVTALAVGIIIGAYL